MRPRDRAERLLALATLGLPAHRLEWGLAMRAELDSIDNPDERRLFARSAARAAFGRGLGPRMGLVLTTGIVVVAVTVTASRLQLTSGGPGLLGVTVLVPTVLVLLVALASAALTSSFGAGVVTGLVAAAASFAAVFAVVAVEGLAWMDRHGVFILDGDPPRTPADTSDVVLDIFTTGMWVGHVVMWVPAVLIGAGLGALIGRRQSNADAPAERQSA